jgi:hypothetical protein
LAATYRRLAAGAQGSAREILGQLARQEQKLAARLAGIRLLITGETQAPPALNLPKEPLERALRRCFGMHLRNMKAWEAQSDHPEYGAIFGELARQQRDQCILVLELLGSFGGRKENNR